VRNFINVIIVDDEENNIYTLKTTLEKLFDYVRVVATATNISEAYNFITNFQPDLLFLDIEMPEGNGFELVEKLRKNKINIKTVIVSASTEHAFKAIKISVFDYIKKPINVDKITATLSKYDYDTSMMITETQIKIVKERILKKISLKTDETDDYFLSPNEIVYAELKGNLSIEMQLVGFNDVILVKENLRDFNELLPKEIFFKLNRNVLINIGYVKILSVFNEECTLFYNNKQKIFKGSELKLNRLRNLLV